MNPFTKKIPRGVIYHKLSQSIRYLFNSFFSPLNEEEKIEEFERTFAEYCGRKHCVAFPFARTAIHFTLKNLNFPKGSEVILPPITIKGIVDAVIDLGLVPVYVDLDIKTINFQMTDLQRKINPKVRAVIITHLFGLVPDVTAMSRLFKEHGIFVIEDFSQCLNGCFDEKRVGTFGEVGIYSSSSIKTLDTLGGGLAITDDEKIYMGLKQSQTGLSPANRTFLVKKAWTNLVRNIATSQPFFSFLTFPFLQLIRKIDPESALKQTGQRNKDRLFQLPHLWFSRYTSIQAKIGLENIHRVSSQDKARIANVEFIKSNCASDQFPATTQLSRNVYWQLILVVPDAYAAQTYLANQGIDSATSSLELVCTLKNYPNRTGLSNAEKIYHNGILIPCFPHLDQKDIQRITTSLKKYFHESVYG